MLDNLDAWIILTFQTIPKNRSSLLVSFTFPLLEHFNIIIFLPCPNRDEEKQHIWCTDESAHFLINLYQKDNKSEILRACLPAEPEIYYSSPKAVSRDKKKGLQSYFLCDYMRNGWL